MNECKHHVTNVYCFAEVCASCFFLYKFKYFITNLQFAAEMY